ncbi:MAG TPA: HAD family phosphatase [Chitinophagales bacterium]|nr:HAD family phosphatase [Chitinophagales bacterium]
MKKPISTLVFDFGGVIINLKNEQDWMFQDLLPNFEQAGLLQLHLSGYFRDLETGNITISEFLSKMESIATPENKTEQKIRQHWNAILLDIPQHRVELIKQLKQHYRLILLSNTNAIHVQSFQQYMLQTYAEDILQKNFHTVYYSQEIGLRKPEKQIYEFVMQQHGITAEEIIFFDDKAENLIAPKKLGWNTVQVPYNQLTEELVNELY